MDDKKVTSGNCNSLNALGSKKIKLSSQDVSTNKYTKLDSINSTLSLGKEKLTLDIISSINDASCTQSRDFGYQQLDSCCVNLEKKIWMELYFKDSELRDLKLVNMMSKHKELNAYHRSMLLDWIMEICEFFNVSRETYYLTIDYIDRYLSGSIGIKRSDFQLVGITCLRIACKIEEVKPISTVDLIYLTDSHYTEKDMDHMEEKIMETIKWRTTVWTPNKWLFAYLHVIKYILDPMEFMELTQLLDLATLDIRSLQFSHTVLAATCLYVTLSVTICQPEHSHLNIIQVYECSSWMEKFWKVVKRKCKKQPCKASDLIPERYRCRLLKYSVHQAYSNVLEQYNLVKKEKL